MDSQNPNVANMEVALKVAKKPTTPWELLELLGDFETDKDPQVAKVMKPIKIGQWRQLQRGKRTTVAWPHLYSQ